MPIELLHAFYLPGYRTEINIEKLFTIETESENERFKSTKI